MLIYLNLFSRCVCECRASYNIFRGDGFIFIFLYLRSFLGNTVLCWAPVINKNNFKSSTSPPVIFVIFIRLNSTILFLLSEKLSLFLFVIYEVNGFLFVNKYHNISKKLFQWTIFVSLTSSSNYCAKKQFISGDAPQPL